MTLMLDKTPVPLAESVLDALAADARAQGRPAADVLADVLRAVYEDDAEDAHACLSAVNAALDDADAGEIGLTWEDAQAERAALLAGLRAEENARVST